ncbi:hypothetical protein MRX96_002046 [Rhipicephalus microplus]
MGRLFGSTVSGPTRCTAAASSIKSGARKRPRRRPPSARDQVGADAASARQGDALLSLLFRAGLQNARRGCFETRLRDT